MEKNLLTEEQVAEMTNLHVQTIRNNRHINKGIPYIKLGRTVRYRPEDVEEYIKNNRVVPEKN